jgi:hypothetical protein
MVPVMDSQWRIARETVAVFDPDRDLDDVLARIRSSKVARVLRYWHSLRKGRRFPARADIDPAEIKSTLPHVMITAISYHPFRVFYRLVGTEIVHWARTDFTNRYADELVFDQDERDWTEYYRRVVDAGMPSYSIADWVEDGSDPTWVESIICPLSDDGQIVDRCLAVEDYEPMSVLEIEALPAVGERQVLVRVKSSE